MNKSVTNLELSNMFITRIIRYICWETLNLNKSVTNLELSNMFIHNCKNDQLFVNLGLVFIIVKFCSFVLGSSGQSDYQLVSPIE